MREMEQRVEERVVKTLKHHIPRDERFGKRLKTYEQYQEWWLNNALPNLLSLTPREELDFVRQEKQDPGLREMSEVGRKTIRGRIWDMVYNSCKKIVHTEEIVNQVFHEFCERHAAHKRLVSSLAVAVVGSTSRMEAELTSDVDVDILFDSSFEMERTCKKWVHDRFLREVSRMALERFRYSGVNALIKDPRIYSYQEIEKELSSGVYDHLSKLLLEGTFIIQPRRITKNLKEWKSKAQIDRIIRERMNWLEYRFRQSSQDIKRGEVCPDSARFHMLVTFHCQIKALNEGGLELARQPVWQIADVLAQTGDESFRSTLRKIIAKIVKARELTVMHSDDAEELYGLLLDLEGSTGIRLLDSIGVIPPQLKLV